MSEQIPALDDELRERAVALARRVEDDEEFLERVQSDPESALREAGLPTEWTQPLFREIGLEADVMGYELAEDDCIARCVIPPCIITGWPPA